MATPHDVSVVVLTQGDRHEALTAALRSVRRQRDAVAEIIVVWNGVEPRALDEGLVDASVSLPSNVGIPAGRNAGAEVATAEVVFFLDDDARLDSDDVLGRALALFDERPRLGAVSCRIVDEDGHTARRHIPRLGGRSADRSSDVTSFLGGVTFVRRSAFDAVGGLPGDFFYAMEETDLSWRLIDEGWDIWYAADLPVFHPRADPSRHPDSARHTARNRVWMTHRLLPAPLGVLYVSVWTMASIVRALRRRSTGHVVATLAGTREGWRTRPGPRRPIRWHTVWRLSRLGRPPII